MSISPEIDNSTVQFFNAMRCIGVERVGCMVVSATTPVSLALGSNRVLEGTEHLVRFTHDKNFPKLAIDDLSDIGFYTEFSVAWQTFRFDEKQKDLVITGRGAQAPHGYELRLHLKGRTVSRGA